MLNVLGRAAGTVGFWLMWPVLYVYFKVTPRRSRVLLVSGNDVLLVRGWLGTGGFELPGGGGHFGEAPAKAALRELREEVGLILRESDLKPLCEGEFKRYGIRVRYVTFSAKLSGKRRLRLRRYEIAEARWVPKKQVSELNISPDVAASISALGTAA